jgi:hypothetical protein
MRIKKKAVINSKNSYIPLGKKDLATYNIKNETEVEIDLQNDKIIIYPPGGLKENHFEKISDSIEITLKINVPFHILKSKTSGNSLTLTLDTNDKEKI